MRFTISTIPSRNSASPWFLLARILRSVFPRFLNIYRIERFSCPAFFAFVWFCIPARGDSKQSLNELLNAAKDLNSQADYARAIPLLKRVIAIDPRNADANSMLGAAYLQSGRPAEAINPLRLAIATNPENQTALGYLGDAEMELKDFAGASEAFEAAIVSSKGSEQALVWWTDFALERYRELEFALRESLSGRAELMISSAEDPTLDAKTRISLLTQAASLNPHEDRVWGELGEAQIEAGLHSDAESSLKRSLEEGPRASSTLKLQCLLSGANGNWNEAEARLVEIEERSHIEFEKLLHFWPNQLTPGPDRKEGIWGCVRNRSTNCLLPAQPSTQQNPVSAEQLYAEGRWETLLTLPPPAGDRSSYWLWRGVAFAETGDCLRAIPALERGLEPGAATEAAQLTNCYRAQALSTSSRLGSEGKLASLHKIRGDILLSIRLDPTRAEAEYKIALGLKPKDPEILEKLAETYFSEGKMGEAKAAAEQAQHLDPRRSQLLRLLIRIAMSERDYHAALTLLGQLSEVLPRNAWAYVQEATAYSQTDRPAEAAKDFKAALEAGYPDPKGSLHAMLATQLRKLGRTEEARRASETAIKLADAYQQEAQQTPDNQP